MEKLTFGAIESPYDKRTVTSDMVTKASAELPPLKGKVSLDFFNLSNQRKIGMCTSCGARPPVERAFVSSTTVSNTSSIETSDAWAYLMQKCLYDDVEYGRHFEGSSIFTALRTRKNYGCPSKAMEIAFPLKLDGTYNDFIKHWRETYNSKIPQGVLNDASKRKIAGYYSVKLDPVSIAREISNGKVLEVRLTVGENTYTAPDGRISWAESDLLPLRRPLHADGGHAMAVNEYDGLTERQLLKGPNSWSDKWGANGYHYFHFDTQKGYFTEAWAVDEIPNQIIEQIKKVSFTKDLTFGDTHADVKRLQEFLNSKGFFVALSGVGSKGHETTYFGNATKKALTDYQVANKIIISRYEGGAGRLGPRTRQFINSQD